MTDIVRGMAVLAAVVGFAAAAAGLAILSVDAVRMLVGAGG